MAEADSYHVVRLERLTSADWDGLIAGEREPWGNIGHTLSWRNKTDSVGVRDGEGRLLGSAGLVLAEVRAGQAPPFEVAGLGGVIVTRAARGRGLARMLVGATIELAGELGVDRSMLFCLPRLMPFYEEFGFREVVAPVRADQPGGRVEMPLRAMWKPLHGDPRWPDGPVELTGEPF